MTSDISDNFNQRHRVGSMFELSKMSILFWGMLIIEVTIKSYFKFCVTPIIDLLT